MIMDQTMFEIIRILVYAVTSICAILITRNVIPYIKSLNLSAEQKIILTAIKEAVRALEQTVTQSGQGTMKKAQVIAFIKNYLAKKGVSITDEEMDKFIEAAVFAMNNKGILEEIEQ